MHVTGSTHVDKLRKVMSESFTEKILKDIDSRNPSTSQPKKFNKAYHIDEDYEETEEQWYDAYSMADEEEEYDDYD